MKTETPLKVYILKKDYHDFARFIPKGTKSVQYVERNTPSEGIWPMDNCLFYFKYKTSSLQVTYDMIKRFKDCFELVEPEPEIIESSDF